MMTESESPKKYARMIRDHLKALPSKQADDPKSVQQALGLSDEQFKKGLDLCIAKKIIVLEKAADKPTSTSPFSSADFDDFTNSVTGDSPSTSWDDAPKKKDSMEMAAASV